ncbi:hypothetical protein BUN10_26050 [Vibrio parahaemolyticus]|nr:hypothetical protein BUN10_26050 [Vibrio parahaemolyticus]
MRKRGEQTGLETRVVLVTPFRSPGLRASASVNVQEPAFATSVPLDIYAFHCYTENSGSPSITLVSQYHVPSAG